MLHPEDSSVAMTINELLPYRRLQGIQAAIQRQQSIMPERDDHRLVGLVSTAGEKSASVAE